MGTKKLFTPEEIAILRANKYTLQVTERHISYTYAFKERFWELSLAGYTGIAAFRELGYDPEVLGFERIHNPTKRIRRAAQTPEGLCERAVYGVRAKTAANDETDFEQLPDKSVAKRLQREIVYLQQQMAFKKRLCSPAS